MPILPVKGLLLVHGFIGQWRGGTSTNIIGELIVEFLTELPDFDSKKHKPFGGRYWLGWLGILVNLIMGAFLAFLVGYTLFSIGKGNLAFILIFNLFLIPTTLFWFWRTSRLFKKMWQTSLYYLDNKS